ncbi:MAG: lactate utilization protein [Peptostreptococcaceae bacterium]|nr:lactate utilization protein [Peptostreptococcaceae bacterium]
MMENKERNFIESFRDKRALKTVEALKKNQMDGYYVHTAKEAIELVESLIVPGSTVSSGGSITLSEIGIDNLLRSGKYQFLDRARAGITPEEAQMVMRQAFTADVYVCGSNAVTENGELFNIDGNGNRVAAITYGPKSVIIVVGYNKITTDIFEARERVKRIASPTNATRVKAKTPCITTGECSDCKAPDRICCTEVVTTFQRLPNRIKVIIVDEVLGF